MENQHRKISGYRELSQNEIDLMNAIKKKEKELLQLIDDLEHEREVMSDKLFKQTMGLAPEESIPLTGEQLEQSRTAVGYARQYLTTGFMWAVRAVALPK